MLFCIHSGKGKILPKRTSLIRDIALNLKSKKQGFGNYQREEQGNSEGEIVEFLAWRMKKTKEFDENIGFETNYWTSLSTICRRTGLHHNTARKAIERLKNKFSILEVSGTRNRRLFSFTDSPNADYIRSKIKQDPSLADRYRKYNSDEFVKKILVNPKFDDDGWLVIPPRKNDPTYNRLRKKPDFLDERFTKVRNKRHVISRKNKRHYASKS